MVQPLVLLQMDNEVALVQPLDPQRPTPVTEGTPCKETTDIPAWPMESGVGVRLLAIVSCTVLFLLLHGHQKSIRLMILQCDES